MRDDRAHHHYCTAHRTLSMTKDCHAILERLSRSELRTGFAKGPNSLIIIMIIIIEVWTVRRIDPEHWVLTHFPGRYTRRTNAVAAHV